MTENFVENLFINHQPKPEYLPVCRFCSEEIVRNKTTNMWEADNILLEFCDKSEDTYKHLPTKVD